MSWEIQYFKFDMIFKLSDKVLNKTTYTKISKHLIRDKKLSGTAFKLLVVMLQSKSNILTTKITMQKLTGFNPKPCNKALYELMDRGYAFEIPIYRSDEFTFDYLYQFYETPTKAVMAPHKGPEPQSLNLVDLLYYAKSYGKEGYESALTKAHPTKAGTTNRLAVTAASLLKDKDYVTKPIADADEDYNEETDSTSSSSVSSISDNEPAPQGVLKEQQPQDRLKNGDASGCCHTDSDILKEQTPSSHTIQDSSETVMDTNRNKEGANSDSLDTVKSNQGMQVNDSQDESSTVSRDTTQNNSNINRDSLDTVQDKLDSIVKDANKQTDGFTIGILADDLPYMSPSGHYKEDDAYKVFKLYQDARNDMLKWARDPKYTPPKPHQDLAAFGKFWESIIEEPSFDLEGANNPNTKQRDILLAFTALRIFINLQGKYLFKDKFKRVPIDATEKKLHCRSSTIKTFPVPFSIINRLGIAHNIQDVSDELIELLNEDAFKDVALERLPDIELYDTYVKNAFREANGLSVENLPYHDDETKAPFDVDKRIQDLNEVAVEKKRLASKEAEENEVKESKKASINKDSKDNTARTDIFDISIMDKQKGDKS